VKRAWCRIHGQDAHMHREACGACGALLDGFGKLTCQARCNGPSLRTWLRADEDQRTWRCVER
jgi:hypothetical protein